MLLYEMFLLYMKKPYAVSTPCAPKEHTDPPFDVKAPTRESFQDSCRPASPKLAPTMNFVHLYLMSAFSMFADFSLISNL